jgi:hypothetical protein
MTRDVTILKTAYGLMPGDLRDQNAKNCTCRHFYSGYRNKDTCSCKVYYWMYTYSYLLTSRARTDAHARISFRKHITDYKMERSRWRTWHDNCILIITFTSLKMLKLGLWIGEDSRDKGHVCFCLIPNDDCALWKQAKCWNIWTLREHTRN